MMQNMILLVGLYFHWEKLFNYKNLYQQVMIFNKTFITIFSTFVPNNLVTCYDRDPTWVNKFAKHTIKQKNKIYENYVNNRRTGNDYFKFQTVNK